MWRHEVQGGTTVYLDAAKKFSAATTAFLDLHSNKKDEDLKVGTLLTFEGGRSRGGAAGAQSLWPQLQVAVRSGLVRKGDVESPLSWYVEKRLCRHKKLLRDYMRENAAPETIDFFASLDAWTRCSPV